MTTQQTIEIDGKPYRLELTLTPVAPRAHRASKLGQEAHHDNAKCVTERQVARIYALAAHLGISREALDASVRRAHGVALSGLTRAQAVTLIGDLEAAGE